MRVQFASKFFRGGISLFEYDRRAVAEDIIEVIANTAGDFDIVGDDDDDEGCGEGCDCKARFGFRSTE